MQSKRGSRRRARERWADRLAASQFARYARRTQLSPRVAGDASGQAAPAHESSTGVERSRHVVPEQFMGVWERIGRLWERGSARLGISSRTASEPDAAPSLGSLGWYALAIEVCYLALIVITPLGGMTQSVSPLARAWPWLLTPAHFFFPSAPLHVGAGTEHNRLPWPAIAFTGALIVASLIAALPVLRSLRARQSTGRHLALVLGAAAAMGLTLALLPSLPSDDVFSYIIYGRIATIHHANPLIAVPADFSQDPFLTFVYWRDVRSVYGPVWLLTSAGVTALAQAMGGSLAVHVLLFKLLGLLCHLVNAALVWAILTAIAPRQRLTGTLFYAWNPLTLLEFSAGAHNDALMLTFLLLSILFWTRQWEIPALSAFGLSVATKYVPLALLPLYLFAVVRQLVAQRANVEGSRTAGFVVARVGRWSVTIPRSFAVLRAAALAIAWRVGVVLAVVAITTMPYWAGPSTLKSLLYSPSAERLSNSLLEAISWPLQWIAQFPFGVRPSMAPLVVETILKVAALLAFVVLWLREFRRARGVTGTLRAWAWVLFWYVVVASGWFWPWYVTWIVLVVALLPWSELSVATLLLAGGVLILYAFRPLHQDTLYGWRALLMFGPAIVYLVAVARRQGRSSAAEASLLHEHVDDPKQTLLASQVEPRDDVVVREGTPLTP